MVDVLAVWYNTFFNSFEQKHQEQMTLPEYVTMTEKLFPWDKNKRQLCWPDKYRTKARWFDIVVQQGGRWLVESASQSREGTGIEDNMVTMLATAPTSLFLLYMGSNQDSAHTLPQIWTLNGGMRQCVRGAVTSLILTQRILTKLQARPC